MLVTRCGCVGLRDTASELSTMLQDTGVRVCHRSCRQDHCGCELWVVDSASNIPAMLRAGVLSYGCSQQDLW